MFKSASDGPTRDFMLIMHSLSSYSSSFDPPEVLISDLLSSTHGFSIDWRDSFIRPFEFKIFWWHFFCNWKHIPCWCLISHVDDQFGHFNNGSLHMCCCDHAVQKTHHYLWAEPDQGGLRWTAILDGCWIYSFSRDPNWLERGGDRGMGRNRR